MQELQSVFHVISLATAVQEDCSGWLRDPRARRMFGHTKVQHASAFQVHDHKRMHLTEPC